MGPIASVVAACYVYVSCQMYKQNVQSCCRYEGPYVELRANVLLISMTMVKLRKSVTVRAGTRPRQGHSGRDVERTFLCRYNLGIDGHLSL